MSKVPYLQGLGISLIDQDRVPSQAAFPRKFNPYASAIWSLVLTEIRDTKPDKAWAFAIQRYLDLCQTKNVYPFREQGGSNQDLLDHLKKCRDELIRVFENTHPPLLNTYSVLQVKRSAELSPKGFVLRVTSTFVLHDPTFKNHLTLMGFVPDGPNKLRHKIGTYTQVQFWYSASRWYVSYVIEGPHIPQILDRLPPKQRLEKFIVEDLWFPLTRSARPDHQGPRFI